MKLALQNYAVIIATDSSYIKFNNNEINSLQTCDNAQNYRILHKAIQRLSQHDINMSNHRHIQDLRQRK
jgi:hypothetical protein